jgi:hypothetical protein
MRSDPSRCHVLLYQNRERWRAAITFRDACAGPALAVKLYAAGGVLSHDLLNRMLTGADGQNGTPGDTSR